MDLEEGESNGNISDALEDASDDYTSLMDMSCDEIRAAVISLENRVDEICSASASHEHLI